MKNVTVFCGSSSGNAPIYLATAFLLGQTLADKEIGLVYGGAKIGLMGAVADGVLSKGGKVLGVIPNFLRNKEIAHKDITQLVVVETMHERKIIMHDRCDGVIALPGGFGTLEELFEMLTWGQLGIHSKPIAILNVNGYFNSLIDFFDRMVTDGLLRQENREMILIHEDISHLLKMMEAYNPPQVGKWISSELT